MADSPETSATEADWQTRDTFGGFIVAVLGAAVVLGGGLFLYYRHAQTKKQVYELDKAARDLVVRDNPKDLLAAKAKFAQALALDASDGFGVSSTALIEVLLAGDDGVASEKAAADDFVARAEALNAPIDEHFTAAALWMLHSGKQAEAEDYVKKVQERGGLPAGLANVMGRIRHAQGKLDESRAFLKKGQDIAWRNPRFADDLADAYLGDGDPINAQAFYEKALEANSQHLRSMIGLARARIARGQDLKKASDDLDTVQALPAGEVTPTLTAMALTARSELRRFEQKYDEAAKLADQAIASDPSYAWAYVAKGDAQAHKNDASAAASFEKAIALDSHTGAFYVAAARGLAMLKNSAKSEEFMQAYAKALKVDDRYHLVYGDLMKGLGNLDKAEAEYNAALKLNGLNAKAHYALGQVLVAKNQMPAAQKEFEAALASQHNFPDAQVQIANIIFTQKKYEDSLQEYAKALVMMKMANVDRAQIDGLLDDVNKRLVAAKEKALAKAWMEQGKQLVR